MSNNNPYPTPMRDPLPSLPGYALRRAANATAAELSARLAEFDLRQSDASVLILIGANPRVTSSEIGRVLDIQRANMVPLLNKLDGGGLISRLAIDGKSRGLELTALGKQRLAEARKVIDAFENELLERVPPEHRPHLLPALEALWR
jgi:DNA-binding MarR family transcriptional regulator